MKRLWSGIRGRIRLNENMWVGKRKKENSYLRVF